MPKSITFLLSGSGQRPVGGFKIVYEYANRLAQRGWRVVVIHPTLLWPAFFKLGLLMKLKVLRAYVRRVITREYLPLHWMKIDPRITLRWTITLDGFFIPDADFVVACPVESSFYAAQYSLKKGKKIYFIQGYEDWNIGKEMLFESWALPFKKIAISSWIRDSIQTQTKQHCDVVSNGIDLDLFFIENAFEQRPAFSICFICHNQELKGSRYAISAIKILKEKYPELCVTTFCIEQPLAPLPQYFDVSINPSQAQIRQHYNAARVYISSSLSEGWGLPPAEAMLCGCVVVVTDIGGHREFIQDGVNGLFCQPGSAESIAEKVEYLFNNPEIATRISGAAPASLQKFDWDSRVELFEQALLS